MTFFFGKLVQIVMMIIAQSSRSISVGKIVIFITSPVNQTQENYQFSEEVAW